jgi:site-specific DNA-cytosine methylase
LNGQKKKEMDDLKNYVDNDDNVYRNIPDCSKKLLDIVPKDAIFIDIGYRHHKHVNSNKYSPSLTCNNRLWNIKKSRYTNIKERLKLQGFNLNFKQVVSKTQMDKQIGNSMSVNVLKCLLEKIIS